MKYKKVTSTVINYDAILNQITFNYITSTFFWIYWQCKLWFGDTLVGEYIKAYLVLGDKKKDRNTNNLHSNERMLQQTDKGDRLYGPTVAAMCPNKRQGTVL